MKLVQILDKYPNDQFLLSNRKNLLIFEEQRGSVVKLFMETLSECKDKKKQFYETWLTKAKDINIITKVSDDVKKEAIREIMVAVEEENDQVRAMLKQRRKNKNV